MRQWYMAYDVTPRVQTGENAVGILLGRGWQSMGGHTPAARMMIAITTSDGKIQVRKTPSRPRSCANFRLLWLYSHRNARASSHLLGQPNTFLA
jgi:hypothetical protein